MRHFLVLATIILETAVLISMLYDIHEIRNTTQELKQQQIEMDQRLDKMLEALP
jgi:hypothetical protein